MKYVALVVALATALELGDPVYEKI